MMSFPMAYTAPTLDRLTGSHWEQVRGVLQQPQSAAHAARALARAEHLQEQGLDVPVDVVEALAQHAAAGRRASVPRSAQAAISAAQLCFAPAILPLEKQLADRDREEARLRTHHSPRTFLTGQPCPPEELRPADRSTYDRVQAQKETLVRQIDRLAAPGEVLTELRGETPGDRMQVTTITGVFARFIPGILCGNYWLGVTWKKRSRRTGQRGIDFVNQVSLQSPWTSNKKFLERPGMGYSVCPVGIPGIGIYVVRDPYFGTNVGVRFIGKFWIGVAERPGGYAVELGGDPLLIGALVLGATLGWAPAALAAAGAWMFGPMTGVMIEHDALKRPVRSITGAVAPKVEALERGIERVWNAAKRAPTPANKEP
jgi:hypothetical protein